MMGPSLDGLESLLRMPYGCGEQNMVNFAPGISIARYLQSTKQLDSMGSVKDKAMRVIQSGEWTCCHRDMISMGHQEKLAGEGIV